MGADPVVYPGPRPGPDEPDRAGSPPEPGAALLAALEILRTGTDRDDIDGADAHDPGHQAATDASAAADMRRLAGEIHDGAVQELIVAGYDLVELVESSDLAPGARELVERIATRIDDAYALLRGVLSEMSRETTQADSDDGLPLVDALRSCARSPRAPARTQVVVFGAGPEPIGPARAVALRTVREGLANVRRHAVATRALVSVRRSDRWWKIDVDDDGTGDEHVLRRALNNRRDENYGLHSLATDALRAGGRLWITRAPGLGGIRLSVSVPTNARRPR